MASMVPVSPLRSVFTFLLTLLLTTPIPGAFGRPAIEDMNGLPELQIVSSISIGKPIFAEKLGPISAGQTLVLTCFSDDRHAGTLSWWEHDSELESMDGPDGDLGPRNLVLKDLSVGDTRRRFTCRDNDSHVTKSVELQIVEPLVILRNAIEIIEDDFVEVSYSEKITLSCILQGYSPAAVSWWEGETELVADATGTQYSNSITLTLEGETLDHMNRQITCQSQGKELPRTVQIKGIQDTTEAEIQRTEIWILVGTFAIIFSVILTAIAAAIFWITKFCVKKCSQKTEHNTKCEEKSGIHNNRNILFLICNKIGLNNYAKLEDAEIITDDAMPNEKGSSENPGRSGLVGNRMPKGDDDLKYPGGSLENHEKNGLVGVFVKSDGTASTERCIHSQKL